ncbi:uncharacterized protein LOC142978020 [Anticarsia gemmatalis]|uniref:uncharacterized protein LOC142978020 n=1 Tax=Anticarsia gemmatalis TaxID=129554 RepID=UPI003F76FE05
MAPKHLFVLLLALFASSVAQNNDELHIPVENDNQFPPDDHSESDLIPTEGSGAGVIEEPLEATTGFSPPILEDVQLSNAFTNIENVTIAASQSCPSPCVCNIEGDSTNYVVDCSNSGLTELPKSLDPKTTKLNLQNNKLTEIPKDISALKELKILNVNNNEIMDVKAGSISELPELTSLKLGNNRLIEFPIDLKNSFGLTKLEELDLGGNDMRTVLKPETFSNFKSLKKLILPSAASDLVNDVCTSLKESLETVCTGSCDTKSIDCADAPLTIDEDLLDVALPGLISLDTKVDETENADPTLGITPDLPPNQDHNENKVESPLEATQETDSPITPPVDDKNSVNQDSVQTATETNTAVPVDQVSLTRGSNFAASPNNDTVPGVAGEGSINQENIPISTATGSENNDETDKADDSATTPDAEITFRSAVIKASGEPSEPVDVEPKVTTKAGAEVPTKSEGEVVGATTSGAKTGGVDKSVIGIIVAGMVLVIAGITIKKNWSSIRNRFSSSPRSAQDRTGVNANGTAPEEVPLQEKSPV